MKIPILISLLVISICCYSQSDTSQIIVPGRTNSIEQQAKPYVILISSDGFRYDYAAKYNAVNLLALSASGIRAASMRPSFPTLTFPNHYTIVTGLYPSHSGLVGNYYYDRSRQERYGMSDGKSVTDGSRYRGVPLWVSAEQQRMITASFYWVGSEADIQKTLPTYSYRYNEKISIERRIQIVIDWLQLPEKVRPHFITFYMPETDHNGHDYGPEAPQTRDAVLFVDKAMKDLTTAIKKTGLPVNFIFLADHGMSTVNAAAPLTIKTPIDTNKFIRIGGGQIFQIYAKQKSDIRPLYKQLKKEHSGFRVYLKNKMPRRLHYRGKDDYHNRIGDIIILPEWPNVIKYSDRTVKPGAHGYDPFKVKEMHAVFYAWGPAFKQGLTVPTFSNVHVYPLIASILGLSVSSNIDGNDKLSRMILK